MSWSQVTLVLSTSFWAKIQLALDGPTAILASFEQFDSRWVSMVASSHEKVREIQGQGKVREIWENP